MGSRKWNVKSNPIVNSDTSTSTTVIPDNEKVISEIEKLRSDFQKSEDNFNDNLIKLEQEIK